MNSLITTNNIMKNIKNLLNLKPDEIILGVFFCLSDRQIKSVYFVYQISSKIIDNFIIPVFTKCRFKSFLK